MEWKEMGNTGDKEEKRYEIRTRESEIQVSLRQVLWAVRKFRGKPERKSAKCQFIHRAMDENLRNSDEYFQLGALRKIIWTATVTGFRS